MLNYLHKAYSLLFYKLVKGTLAIDKVFTTKIDMTWVMSKAMFALFFLNLNWFMTLPIIVKIVSGKTIPNYIENSTIQALIFMGIIYLFNYCILIHKKKWAMYNEEFENYSKTKNKKINIAIISLYVFSILSYFIVVRIWADLGHAGKIEGFLDN